MFQHCYKETDLVLTDSTGKELGTACWEPFPAQGVSASPQGKGSSPSPVTTKQAPYGHHGMQENHSNQKL